MAKYLQGMASTTINSTITELFPALAFNNGESIKNHDQMHEFVVELARKRLLSEVSSKQSFVDNNDLDSAYGFIGDTFQIRPDMLKEKLSNAVGILDYLYRVDKDRPIEKIIWGYRAKPKGVDNNHAGDIFIYFKSGNPKISGISLKAGTKKSAEPKMNSYVRPTIQKSMWRKSDPSSEKRLKEKLWTECYSKLPGLPKKLNKSNWIILGNTQRPDKEVVAAVLRQFQQSEKIFDELYQIQNEVCRQHICDMINNDFDAAIKWIGEEFRLETQGSSTEVPLTLVKAIGSRAEEQGDKLAKMYPRITRDNAYLSKNSVQEWFIDVYSGSEKLTLLMTIRSDSKYRESKQKGKLGAFMQLKLLYRGYK